MKSFRLAVLLVAVAIMPFVLVNCKQPGNNNHQTEQSADKSGPEYTSAYVCPMHCKGSGGDEPGECPICGMAYKANPDHEMHQQDEAEAEPDEVLETTDSTGADSE